MNPILRLVLLFFLYLLLQVFVFEHLSLGNVAVAHVFLVYLLFLPLTLSKPILYGIAFMFGLLMDVLLQRVSASMMASLALIGAREWWVAAITPQFVMGGRDELALGRQTLPWYISYTLLLVGLYELVYYSISELSLGLMTWWRALASTAYTSFFILIFVLLFYRKEDRRR